MACKQSTRGTPGQSRPPRLNRRNGVAFSTTPLHITTIDGSLKQPDVPSRCSLGQLVYNATNCEQDSVHSQDCCDQSLGQCCAPSNTHANACKHNCGSCWDAKSGNSISVLYDCGGFYDHASTTNHGTPAIYQRRGSRSSTISSRSVFTPEFDSQASSYSPATTPESMSPASLHYYPMSLQPPEMTFSQKNCGRTLPTSSSSKTVCAGSQTISEPSGSVLTTHGLSGEEGRDSEVNRIILRRSRLRESRKSSDLFSVQPVWDDGAVSSLHQRRQQRQEKTTKYSPFPKTVLSPLPPLPLQQQASPTALKRPVRGLNREASRSLPQLRHLSGPPPSEALPPLPPLPKFSPMFPPSPTTINDPSPAHSKHYPPQPTSPPPPPPQAKPLFPRPTGKENIPLHPWALKAQLLGLGTKSTGVASAHPVPEKSSLPHTRQKGPRSHKSLGNLRSRSRAHSTSDGSARNASSSTFIHSAASSRSTERFRACGKDRLEEPLPPVPQLEAPAVFSVFEDDSDDEGDTVRRLVRNFFSRRTRSSEINTSSMHEKPAVVSSSSATRETATFAKAADAIRHNSRRQNYSSSSSFSTATTAGASTIKSTGTTATDSSNDAGYSSIGGGWRQEADDCQVSTEQTRQRGALLARIFVRRSH